MDQLKDILKQCIKYRFWIAVGISLLLPMIGYFVGVGTMAEATTKREVEIKGAKADVTKYTTPGVINGEYQPIAAQKKEVLANDVIASWRKLFASQEPLLRWPEEVEAKFQQWGRKYPRDVDKGQVTNTIIDYATAYPNFLSKVYKTFKPFNFDDGTGIVVAPDEKALLKAPVFSPDAPPELGKVWAEQERIWVVTALLDVVAKVNDSVGAKDWDKAIIKQINLIEVGAQTDQDQISMVKGETLVPADVLNPDGTSTPATSSSPSTPSAPGMPGMPGGGGGAATDEVYYLKTEGTQYKTLPIKMVVLVEQDKLPNFLVGLENSPMSILVKEAEIAKPLTPVMKPAYGERQAFGNLGMSGGPGGGMGDMVMGGGASGQAAARGMKGGMGGGGMSGPGAMPGAGPGAKGMMGGGGAADTKKGVDNRSAVDKAKQRKADLKKAATKTETKSKVDQYYNIIEVTVYGQARFYLAPPPPPPTPASSSTPQPPAAPDVSKKEEPAKPEAPKPADAPKDDQTPKKDETPKTDETPKPDAPKAEAGTPKTDEPKADPEKPKADAPKAEPPKGDSPPPGKP